MVSKPVQYALIGNPLGHSFSPEYFNSMFREKGIQAEYVLRQLPSIDALTEMIENMPELRGFNVTIPYKRDIISHLDKLDETASHVGAVNTVKLIRNNGKTTLKGYNTDVAGFLRALTKFLKENVSESHPYPERALILGTGGASAAVAYALDKLNIKYLFLTRSKKLSGQMCQSEKVIEYSDLSPELIYEHRLIINTTPAGMYPDTLAAPPFPWEYLSKHHFFFDLIYNPTQTLAMRISAAHGAKTTNGLEMLHAQADAAWEIWQK
ncbi:MAG: shikimate dehydrogenase [Bacteroidales bacterium]|nr:shikimate dehydrogenase [Bacteroidales bacterium]